MEGDAWGIQDTEAVFNKSCNSEALNGSLGIQPSDLCCTCVHVKGTDMPTVTRQRVHCFFCFVLFPEIAHKK